MDINIIAIGDWLSKGVNWLFIPTLIAFIMGSFLAAVDILDSRRIFIGKVTQSVITGIVGSLVIGIPVGFTILPLGLLFKPSIYVQWNEHRDRGVFLFLKLVITSIKLSTLINLFLRILIYSSVLGFLLGLAIGTSSVLFLSYSKRQNEPFSPNTIKSRIISWSLLSISIGLAFGINFGIVIGIISGFLLGFTGFSLKLHPKQIQTSNQINFNNAHLISWRTILFWIIICTAFLLIIFYFIKLVFFQNTLPPIISLFLLIILLIFFIFLQLRGVELSKNQKPTVSIFDKRKEAGVLSSSNHKELHLKISYPKIIKAFTTGLICGILLYGIGYGLPMAYFFGQAFGSSVGLIAELAFCTLGLGLGIGCGCIFIYIYVLGPILAYKIVLLPKRTIQRIGFALLLLSGITGIILGFFPSVF